MTITPAMFRSAVQRYGYGVRNTQDGAHELYHALTCAARLGGGRSQREDLNKDLEECFPGIERWWNEVEARVVERLLCARLGTEAELLDLDRALHLSIEEAEHYEVPRASFEKSKEYALNFAKTKRARAAVDLMMAYAKANHRADD